MDLGDIFAAFHEAETKLKELPQSREKTLVLTKLDEARLWLGELSRNAQ